MRAQIASMIASPFADLVADFRNPILRDLLGETIVCLHFGGSASHGTDNLSLCDRARESARAHTRMKAKEIARARGNRETETEGERELEREGK
jgi:hypothetical protein